MASKLDNPFCNMRFILPEQKAAILEHYEECGLQEKPDVDEEEFGEMCFRIYDSTQYDYAIRVKWFENVKGQLGTIESAWGVVKEIDSNRRRFKLVCDWDSVWINIENLISVTK